MRPGSLHINPHTVSVRISPLICLLFLSLSIQHSLAAPPVVEERNDNPLHIDWSPAPSPEDGPPFSANALRNTAFLPAQIGGIVGAYAVSLVLVAITLLALSKKRRQHLRLGDEDIEFDDQKGYAISAYPQLVGEELAFARAESIPNFSYPSPTRSEFTIPLPQLHTRTSSVSGPGIDPFVDQRIVAADRAMAQSQLEEMYKHVMEHEEAKLRGELPPAPPSIISDRQPSVSERSTRTTISKKERSKPSNLNLSAGDEDKQSRTSSILSALRSPKKRSVKGVSISSPIMTPQSGTFPRHESREMAPISPRHYAPAAPPPVPAGSLPPLSIMSRNMGAPVGAPITPDISPESIQSIDERLGLQTNPLDHSRSMSQAPTEVDPESATTEHSQVPLVGLPASPRLEGRFPSLPSSPKPGATFQRPNPVSAVRTGGTLPLRAYEPALSSPSAISHTTKQTVFERKGPLSPMSARTPGTAVPYSPYQPFTPCMPVTPSLVTKEDRKRMRKMMPKTPTTEMVKSPDEVW